MPHGRTFLTDLDKLQAELARRFFQLARARGETASEAKLFCLEHDLSKEERGYLRKAVQEASRLSPPLDEHWLAWAVYATEIGYAYEGEEYWPTFGAETPGWHTHGLRSKIRSYFQKFIAEYNGFQPTGLWANHFSIIALPISHAILPRDLQSQVCRLLYNARFELHDDTLASPLALGRLIARHSVNFNRRLQNLAESERLLGQVAIALLHGDDPQGRTLISPATLHRITEDLERTRAARDWLKGAKQTIHLRGARNIADSTTSRGGIGDTGSRQGSLERTRLVPGLFLVPGENQSWRPFLRIPGVNELVLARPDLREAVLGCRYSVPSSSSGFSARGELLHADNHRLHDWPKAGEHLLHLKGGSPALTAILDEELKLSQGPTWLFRVSSDGRGLEIRTKTLRTGTSYIVLSTDSLETLAECSQIQRVECEGVRAIQLDVPDFVTPAFANRVKALGIGLAGKLDLWPAGLCPPSWDGDGQVEWLVTDTPIVGIQADSEIDTLTIGLVGDQNSPLKIDLNRPRGKPVFVELPQLAEGQHVVEVSASAVLTGNVTPVIGHLQVSIRNPRDWLEEGHDQGAFLLRTDPVELSLESLWEGDAQIELHGPRGARVSCVVELRSRRPGDSPLLTKKLPDIRLPFLRDAWATYKRSHLETKFDKDFDAADRCVFRFNGDHLGTLSLELERELTALRWSQRWDDHQVRVQLHDDTGSNDVPRSSFFSFDKPDIKRPLGSGELIVPHTGGLYAGEQGDSRCSILIGPTAVPPGFSGLSVHAEVARHSRSVPAMLTLISILDSWSNTRIVGGTLAVTRQRAARAALLSRAFDVIAGDKWGAVDRGDREFDIERAKHIFGNKPSELRAWDKILDDISQLRQIGEKERAMRVAEFLARSGSTAGPPDAQVVEFALRLASADNALLRWSGRDLDRLMRQLLEVPAIARASRFLVLTMETRDHSLRAGELYHGWDW